MSVCCSGCPPRQAPSPRRSCARLASKTERPIIFPLSNPTSRAEAHPAELDEWTDGRALIATGSPFAPLQRDGGERPVAQCNNVYIFPAMGLAVTAAQATRVTDEMMRVAAATLGDASPALVDPELAAAARVVGGSRHRGEDRARRRSAGRGGRGRAEAQRRRVGRAHRRGPLAAGLPVGLRPPAGTASIWLNAAPCSARASHHWSMIIKAWVARDDCRCCGSRWQSLSALAQLPPANGFQCPPQSGQAIVITVGDIDCITASDFAAQYDLYGDKFQQIGPFICYSGMR